VKIAAAHPREPERLATLREYEVLDSEFDVRFELLAEHATLICGVPVGLIAFVDEGRQWFKATIGLDARETPREVAFCAHTILGHELLVVSDARLDDRFHDNPLVTGGPRVVFYAGAPVFAANGLPLGTVCAVDTVPHQLDEMQRRGLWALARQLEVLLEARQRTRREQTERRPSSAEGVAEPEAIQLWEPGVSGAERFARLTEARAWTDVPTTAALALQELLQRPTHAALDTTLRGETLRAATIVQVDAAAEIGLSIGIRAEQSFFTSTAEELFGPDPGEVLVQSVLFETANIVMGAIKRSFEQAGLSLTTDLPSERELTEPAVHAEVAPKRQRHLFACGSGTIEVTAKIERIENQVVRACDARRGMVLATEILDRSGAVIGRCGAQLNETSARHLASEAASLEIKVAGILFE
jgi:GAF domain-containing protein